MARPCTVCSSPHRDAIDLELVAGRPIRAMARHYGLGREAITRHRDQHLPATLAQAHAAEEVARSDALLERLRFYQRVGEALLLAALNGEMLAGVDDEDLPPDAMPITADDVDGRRRWARPELALKALRELRGGTELLARLEGELPSDDDATVTVIYEDDWQAGAPLEDVDA